MDKVIFHHLSVGILGTNCYIFGDAESREVIVIDPASRAKRIKALLDEENAQLKAIINTHGHFDHIGANKRLHDLTSAPIWLHKLDAPMLKEEHPNYKEEEAEVHEAQGFLEDGQEIALGSLIVKVLHTPGHTKGGICLYCEDYLFSGDTLFQHDIGRCDLPGGDYDTIIRSIKEKLLVLPNEVKVFPGHGSFSTIGDEREHNPYLKD